MISLKSHANKTNHVKSVTAWAFLKSGITIYLPNGQQQSRGSPPCVPLVILQVCSYLIRYMGISLSGRTHSLADPDDFVDSWSLGILGLEVKSLGLFSEIVI